MPLTEELLSARQNQIHGVIDKSVTRTAPSTQMVITKSEVLGGGAQSTQVLTARCINQGRGRAEKPRRGGKPEPQPRGREG